MEEFQEPPHRLPDATDVVPCSSSSQYPYCMQYVYQDPDHLGFTWLACDSTPRAVLEVWATPTGMTTTSTDPVLPPSSPPPEPSPATPVGAIVGGVLGGVAGLALLVSLGVWYFMHRRKKTVANGETQQQSIAQELLMPGAAGSAGYRGSMVKSPEFPGSPPVPGYGMGEHQEYASTAGLDVAYNPPPPQGYYPGPTRSVYPWGQASPGQPRPPVYGGGQQQPPPPSLPAELDTRREDGEVRELEG
jgi:hypothetical protein